MLDHAIVVATRNRLDMLRVTLPLMVHQTRTASRIIIVDRSDDHEAVRSYCEELAADAPMPFEVVYGEQANLPAQRNQGLDLVTEPVVMYPDDDSMWYPDTAEQVMAVYEADTNQRFGAVSATPVQTPPTQTVTEVPLRKLRFTNITFVMDLRNRLETALVPQPFEVYGRHRISQLAPAARADGLDDYPLIETIAGYRMSYRTDVAKALRFDPVLGSRIGYATHEDKDMGLRVLASGSLMAAAPAGLVFHNVAPGQRTGGFSYGFFHIFNYLYICKKVFPEHSRALAVTHRYLAYKVFLYGLRRSDQYALDVHRGAKAAMSEYETIMKADTGALADVYAEICARHL